MCSFRNLPSKIIMSRNIAEALVQANRSSSVKYSSGAIRPDSSRRRVGGFGGLGGLRDNQLRNFHSNGSSLPGLAVDIEAEFLAVEDLQALADVRDADAGLGNVEILFRRSPHA